MASGDVVAGLSAQATILNVQPAAGVELVIKIVFADNNDAAPQITDGTNVSLLGQANAYLNSGNPANMTMLINNTYYLYVQALLPDKYSGYLGIQIK